MDQYEESKDGRGTREN
jgi:elongation factor 1 alpha-like protein